MLQGFSWSKRTPFLPSNATATKIQCTGNWDLSSSFKKKFIWKSIYAYFSLSIDVSPLLHTEGAEGRKERKEGGCLATGILHQTKKERKEKSASAAAAPQKRRNSSKTLQAHAAPSPQKIGRAHV